LWFACLASATTALGQQKIYRGSIGGRNIEMQLTFQGTHVSGTYSYDNIGESLKVDGQLDTEGRLKLTEFVGKKPTGKFSCNHRLDDPNDPDCTWTRADGTHESFVSLFEQHVEFTNGTKIVPQTIADRRAGVRVSYPQLSNDKGLTPAAQAFNRRVLSLVQKRIKTFEPGPEAARNSFEMNYNVQFAVNEIISVEMSEASYAGGAHPNSNFWSVNYDLAANKVIDFDSLFKPDSDYKMAIAKYVVADIERRASVFEEQAAREEGRQPNRRNGPLVSVEELSEVADWGITPAGLVVYFDFPHAIAVFDRNLIPYHALKEYLNPNSPAARAAKF
jgi:hypothetical protein